MLLYNLSHFSIFIQNEIKRIVKSRMSEEMSRSFLIKLAHRWNNLPQNEKDILKKEYDESKEEMKKNVKEFIFVFLIASGMEVIKIAFKNLIAI